MKKKGGDGNNTFTTKESIKENLCEPKPKNNVEQIPENETNFARHLGMLINQINNQIKGLEATDQEFAIEKILPTDNNNILNSWENIKYVVNALEFLGFLIIPDFYDEMVNVIASAEKQLQNPNLNQIYKDKLLIECKLYLLHLINILGLQEKTLNDSEFILDTSDISKFLASIKFYFPEFEIKLPSKTDVNKEDSVKYEGKAFIKDKEYMASGPIVCSAYKAYISGTEQWSYDTDLDLAYFNYKGSKKPSNYIEHYISNWDQDKLIGIPFNEAIQILDKFGLDTAKLHLILCIHAYRQPIPYKAEFYLKGTDLIKDLGWEKRTDLSLETKLEKVLEIVNATRSLLVKAQWDSEHTKGKKKVTLTHQIEPSLMWDIVPEKIGQKNLFTNNVEVMTELEIKVRPGLWSSCFLNEAGYALNKALFNFSVIAENIMSLHPINEETALRIAMIQSIMPYRQYYTVEQWLIENMPGGAYKIDKARNDQRRAYELKNLWDNNVIFPLTNIGIKIHYDIETYPEDLRPGNKVSRGYFERFLKAKCKFEPPTIPKPQSHLQKNIVTVSPPSNLEGNNSKVPPKSNLEENNSKTISKAQKTITGCNIKKARTENKITQEQLAKYFDKSKMYISKIERGELKITPKVGKEILAAITFLSKHPKN